MKSVVTITDLTRMQRQHVCIAGYLTDGTCVRPVLPRGGGLLEGWLRFNGQVVIRPFAVVELDLQDRAPEPPHTEDWIIDPVYRAHRGMLAAEEQKALLTRTDDSRVEGIFGAPIYQEPGWYIRAGEGTRSLGTVRPREIHEISISPTETGGWHSRLTFTDQAGRTYRLAVTDLACHYYLDRLRTQERLTPSAAARRLTGILQHAEVYLRIGLARRWEKYPERCYVQITGVFTFPDYLGGRCFADLAPPP